MSQLRIELRPGEGGDDAYAFCLELTAAIVGYARRRGDVVRSHQARPGSRTVEVLVDGHRRAYERLAGVHRVQRIPKNDRRGRRHTSTATVAVLDRRPSTVVEVADEDLDVYTYRGSGKGGQHRNKTDSAVRVVHRPTGTTVIVEHGRSQWQNLRQAKIVLTQRLQEAARRADCDTTLNDRNRQIVSGERPVKQFTHNEQRSEVESHQTGEVWRWSDFYRGRIGGGEAA
jgi:peptide chain release factor 1